MAVEPLRAKSYRERAEELRAMLDGVKDPTMKKILTRIIEDYDRMAPNVERIATSLEKIRHSRDSN